MHKKHAGKWNKKKAMSALLLVLGIALVCFIGVIAAKYISQETYPGNQIGAKDFYFSVDAFLEDEHDENAVVTKQVDLYGVTQNSYTFHVVNAYDALRINQEDIHFNITCETAGVTLREEDGAAVSGNGYTLPGGDSASQGFTVTFDELTDNKMAEIVVTSTSPYKKIMRLQVVAHPQNYDVLYRVEDEPGKTYARLVVMAGVDVSARELDIDWSGINTTENTLQIDTTDTDILNQVSGVDSAPGAFMTSATNNDAIAADGSIAVYFFKADPSQNYAIDDTPVVKSGSRYPIHISKTN